MLETAVRDGTKKRLHPCALYAPRMFGRVNGERNVEKYLHIYIDYHNTLSKAAPMHMLVVCNALTMFNWCKDAGTFAEQARGSTGTPSWASAHVTTKCTLEMDEQTRQHPDKYNVQSIETILRKVLTNKCTNIDPGHDIGHV